MKNAIVKNLNAVCVVTAVSALTFGSAAMAATPLQEHDQNKAEQAMEQTGDYLSDAAITTKVKSTILASDALNVLQINVETNDGVVQLSGFVADEEDIDTAERIVRGIDGVKDVENDIQVKQDASS
ncbi:BON domain-containing protein [Pseudidiomarina sediminum]|uniref:BON domain-containing protein n=1 Tax=Pseudidiomarina sediminum TaxID=431675 RepID=UPI001C9703C9|nr:BON domain-containing protein [Pseudidiomarina sediminum]MBY6062915.1 BON domain-containing protein [Pseudidiomarina sediminum]